MEKRICIPVQEFAHRVKKAQKLMVEQDIDIMFAFANEAEPQFVRYLSDYWPSFETAAVIFGQEGDPILLIGPESLTYASDRSKIKDIRRIKSLRESSNPEYPGVKLDTMAEAIEAVRTGSIKKLAVAGYNMLPYIVYQDLKEALSSFGEAEIIRGDDLLMSLRMIKSPSEIACLRKAGDITVKALENVLAHIKPGMTEQQVCGLAMEAIFANGGEMEAYPIWVLAGKGSNQAISRPRSKVIQKTDYVHLTLGARYEGYAASIGRGVFFGEPDSWTLHAMKAGYEAIEVISSQLYEGNNAAAVAREYFASLAKTGHDKYTLYGPCHATGLMEGEPPWIEIDSNYELHENMCYCIDIFMGNEKGYGLRIEEGARVGKDKADIYTPFAREVICL